MLSTWLPSRLPMGLASFASHAFTILCARPEPTGAANAVSHHSPGNAESQNASKQTQTLPGE
jgi:hypothetical protein